MKLKEHVQVGAHDPEFDDPGPLLPRDGGKEPTEKPCYAGGDKRGTIAGGPDEMDVEAVPDESLPRGRESVSTARSETTASEFRDTYLISRLRAATRPVCRLERRGLDLLTENAVT